MSQTSVMDMGAVEYLPEHRRLRRGHHVRYRRRRDIGLMATSSKSKRSKKWRNAHLLGRRVQRLERLRDGSLFYGDFSHLVKLWA